MEIEWAVRSLARPLGEILENYDSFIVSDKRFSLVFDIGGFDVDEDGLYFENDDMGTLSVYNKDIQHFTIQPGDCIEQEKDIEVSICLTDGTELHIWAWS